MTSKIVLQDEIKTMSQMLRSQGETLDEATGLVQSHIKKNEPVWKLDYFDDKKYTSPIKSVSETYADKIIGWLPQYKTLQDAKNEMDRVNSSGYDNYAHRLGMCRIGQMGAIGAIQSHNIGIGLGLIKEAKDIYDKSYIGSQPLRDSLYDSWKDMKNNVEGLNWGLNNPDKECRFWLKDLDIKTNTWRK